MSGVCSRVCLMSQSLTPSNCIPRLQLCVLRVVLNNLLLQLSFAMGAREQRLQQYIEYGCQPLSAPFHSCTTACRREICHKHHKQRLCKIISSRVKFHFVSVLLEQFVYVSCGFCGNLKVLR